MVATEDMELPTVEELTVEELNISSPALRAGAYHLGKYCDEQSKEFMLCRREEKDPRKCIQEGKAVTACALEFFRKVKQTCRKSFDDYSSCLDYSSQKLEFDKCRKTQAVYDRCMLDNLGMQRPVLGYFATPRVHHTQRPKPEPLPRRDYAAETPTSLPDDYPREPAKFGSRFYFFN